MTQEQECRYLIPGLEKGLNMLLQFSQQRREMTFAELQRLGKLPKATAYRVVQTLEHMGFLQRHPRNNTFSLGINVLRLGFEFIASLDVVQLGQPVIEQLRDRSQCSSHLAIRDGQDVIYVARVSAAEALINEVRVGTRLPVHRTSLGRMLLTDISRDEFDKLYPQVALPCQGSGGPGDRETLWDLVQQDKEQGYVIGESFYHYGISSIVFPIYNREARVEAVTSILVPSDQIPGKDKERLIDEVRQAARRISTLLGAADQ
ncbi:MAG: IclR family transcriptional regulator [Enterobacteriaceae bacterium]